MPCSSPSIPVLRYRPPMSMQYRAAGVAPATCTPCAGQRPFASALASHCRPFGNRQTRNSVPSGGLRSVRSVPPSAAQSLGVSCAVVFFRTETCVSFSIAAGITELNVFVAALLVAPSETTVPEPTVVGAGNTGLHAESAMQRATAKIGRMPILSGTVASQGNSSLFRGARVSFLSLSCGKCHCRLLVCIGRISHANTANCANCFS